MLVSFDIRGFVRVSQGQFGAEIPINVDWIKTTSPKTFVRIDFMRGDPETLKSTQDRKRLRKQLWLAGVVWSLLVAFLLLWSLSGVDGEMLGLARQEAIANYNKDQAFRAWGTAHGGVYAEVTERTKRNPYLSHIEERDLVTPGGRQLTLMNPAYMLRQLMEEYDELYGVKGRITSLLPLNPDNTPDAWEAAALLAFTRGEKERFEVTEIDGEPFLRLIRPMVTTEGCLLCHAHQGYKEGDIQGGVGVAVPLDGYLAVAEGRKWNLSVILGLIWAVGMIVIWLTGRRGFQRIRERLDYEDQIWQQANFDSLTGLSNRSLFMDRMDRALSYVRRHSDELALLYIDLDRFKDVNDTRGHACGDRLLQEAARRLQGCVREMDTVSRLGGDEFTVILPEIADSLSATAIANKILGELARPFDLDGCEIHLSASIGITTYPEDGDTPGVLLQNADTAMYRAKSGGRNTYRFFTWEMNQEAEGRVSLESDLRQALKRDEFDLHYQPVFDLAEGRLVGAEALLRWESPGRDPIGPDTFVPLAEGNGLIVPLGEWVLQRAIADLRGWDQAGLILETLSVNVSTIQFRASGFLEQIQLMLNQHPYLKSRLVLEITESVFMDGYGEAGKALDRLRKQGVGIAIDDFGTGYSSLSYLKRFPVDNIKIDRSFVRDVTSDPDDAALCDAIIAMAHHLGLQVIAEGVETDLQQQFLRDSGCDLAQGYLLGRPMSGAAFEVFLREHLPVDKAAS